jgi:hypothetical protein
MAFYQLHKRFSWHPGDEPYQVVIPMVCCERRVTAYWRGRRIVARSVGGCAFGLLRAGAGADLAWCAYLGSLEGARIETGDSLGAAAKPYF